MAEQNDAPPAAEEHKPDSGDGGWTRWFVFAYSLAILIVLLVLALFYANDRFTNLDGSVVSPAALAAAWAGALGGVASSFKGVYDHKNRHCDNDSKKSGLWCSEMVPWHLGRPFTGIIVGIFVFIALKAVYPSGSPSPYTLAAASFVLGTQDRAFFTFVRQIGGTVLSVPGDPQASANPTTSQVDTTTREEGSAPSR